METALDELVKKHPDSLLYAPEGYWNLSNEEKKEICNGCGPKGLGGWVVPDTLYGLDISEACNIHDYMYTYPESVSVLDKDYADAIFHVNMDSIIEAESGWALKWLRKRRAEKYYWAVKRYGTDSFLRGKLP